MENVKNVSDQLSPATPESSSQVIEAGFKTESLLKRVRGGFLLVIGYLLSPLCWWNDLVFNLPIAYFFGYLCSWFSPSLLLPCSIVGYWLSNIVGILMMQFGAMDVVQKQSQERNLKKELLTGLVSSTAYTLLILALIHFKILDTPLLSSLIPGDS